MVEEINFNDLPEGKAIIDFIIARIKKGLGVNILVYAPPGLGKSYACMRIMELIYQRLFNERLLSGNHIVDDIPEAFSFIRQSKRFGEPLTIEEVSVLASSRRSMSSDNVGLNYLLDTCRKKQIILLMNAPHMKFVDSHIQMMCHLTLECLRINKTEGIVIVKPMKLQTSPSGKIYRHRLKDENGREIHRSFFKKPTEELIRLYEGKKDKFLQNLYETMELKAKKKKEKEMKDLGVVEKKQVSRPLTSRELEVYQRVSNQRMSQKETAKELGISIAAVSQTLKRIEKLVKISDKPISDVR
jgi:DNA-binding CsgD family transcriptional regulator